MKPQAEPRSAYRHFLPITTRWMDNDVYGHVNNVVYYSYFDTVVNRYLIEQECWTRPRARPSARSSKHNATTSTHLAFPIPWWPGCAWHARAIPVCATRVGLFRGEAETAAAQGHFVHVYVDRASRRPVPLPEALRRVLSPLAVELAESA